MTGPELLRAGHVSSEELNPVGALIVGRLFARVTAAKASGDDVRVQDAYANLWYAANGLQRLAIGVRTATHFSLAANNNLRWIRGMCIADTGIDPEQTPAWN